MPDKKPSAKHISDVSRPGKTPASATSKPVIVTNRPILQDPMVVSESEDEKAPMASSGTTIQPLTAPEISSKKSDSKNDETMEEAATDVEAAQEQAPAPPEDSAKLQEIAATKTIADLDAESKARTTKPESTSSTDEEEKVASTDTEQPKESLKGDNGLEDEVAKAEAAAKKDAALQKMLDDKQYFLPINTVEKRRSKRVVTGGILISLVLAIAWLDVALDAGLIGSNGLPHTHYFDHGSVATTPAAVPVGATTKLYKTAVAKLNFKYPSDWTVSASGTAQNDNLLISPAKESNLTAATIAVNFKSPNTVNAETGRTVKHVSYQRLASSTKDTPLYERDVIYKIGSGSYQIAGYLANDKVLQPQDEPANYFTSFTAPNSSEASFVISVSKTGADKDGFATVDAAKNFIKTADYQKARRILLSLTVQKS